ncbi:MAG: uracil-DNA glycosylase [Verrucomicrobia bacterium]|nr:uracil-DNA glycosylase [Verrucomicrobiota bacterium]
MKQDQAVDFIPFSLEPSWQKVLAHELQEPYLVHLAAFVKQERSKVAIYPPEELVFNALTQTPFDKVRVVIMGQDPYHGPGQAHGLSFSVLPGVALPPSLKNIYKELVEDVGITMPSHGCLFKWAEQGVLLLNATLTVRQDTPLSHNKMGWERFTDAVIRVLAQRKEPVIFVFWGKNAAQKGENVKELGQNRHHFILTAAHPSPFSAHSGFFGCRHFSKINSILEKQGLQKINWQV